MDKGASVLFSSDVSMSGLLSIKVLFALKSRLMADRRMNRQLVLACLRDEKTASWHWERVHWEKVFSKFIYNSNIDER